MRGPLPEGARDVAEARLVCTSHLYDMSPCLVSLSNKHGSPAAVEAGLPCHYEVDSCPTIPEVLWYLQ
jgi:hypothetical protein